MSAARVSAATLRIRSGTQAIERAFAVLKEVATANASGVALPTLVKKVRLNRTTIYRILRCLIEQNAVRHDGSTKRYFIGPLTFELGMSAREQLDLKALFAPALTRLAEKTGDTVFLMLKSGNDAVCIDRRLGSYPVKTLVVEVGTRRPLGVGAGSLAILSAMPENDIPRIIHENSSRLSEYGKTPDSLLKAARNSRKLRYVSADVYGIGGVKAVGLPIIDPEGKPIAAMSIAAIAKRMPKKRQLESVQLLRQEITRLEELMSNINLVDR